MPPAGVRYWPTAAIESYKLAPPDSGWNLAGCAAPASRTRSGHGSEKSTSSGSKAADAAVDAVGREPPQAPLIIETDTDADADDEAEEDEDLDESEEEHEEKKRSKPEATRVIIEVSAMMDTLAKNCRCMECGSEIKPELETTCIATSIKLTCKSSACGYLFYSGPPATASVGKVDKRERSTDYAVNVLFVVGLLACGDGCTEAAKVLGLLGLPNDTTMEGRSFPTIEDRISRKVKQVTDEILLENLVEEVRLTVKDNTAFKLWKDSLATGVLPIALYPRLAVSYDMAWQQRNSGHKYNSPSGHAILVGKLSRKPLTLVIKSKLCNFCSAFRKKNPDMEAEDVPPHDCMKNHVGSSSSMEPQACLEMSISIFDDWRCVVESICIDDDASTRSIMRWSNADYMKNNNTTKVPMIAKSKGKNQGELQKRPDFGKLPGHIPEPVFVADPNHRVKVLTGEMYNLEKQIVSKRFTMTKMDSSRIGKNFGYMVRTLPKLQECQYLDAAKAVLEHHFDEHKYCGDWCKRKSMTPAQALQSPRYYRDKNKPSDAQLYDVLTEKISRFITLDRLREVAHGMDSQVNESFNNTVSWFAPKNKVYCGSLSLSNRIGLALGINALGLHQYYIRLFKALGIQMTDNVSHFLQVQEKRRSSRLTKLKTRGQKKLRCKNKFAKLKSDEQVAQHERRKREGTYKSGRNMAEGVVDGYTVEDQDERPQKKKQKRTSLKDWVCVHCGLTGHKTTKSMSCGLYTGNRTAAAGTQAGALTAGDKQSDQDDWDKCPLSAEASDVELFGGPGGAVGLLSEQSGDDDSVGIIRANL
jgi:hypothetical protein